MAAQNAVSPRVPTKKLFQVVTQGPNRADTRPFMPCCRLLSRPATSGRAATRTNTTVSGATAAKPAPDTATATTASAAPAIRPPLSAVGPFGPQPWWSTSRAIRACPATKQMTKKVIPSRTAATPWEATKKAPPRPPRTSQSGTRRCRTDRPRSTTPRPMGRWIRAIAVSSTSPEPKLVRAARAAARSPVPIPWASAPLIWDCTAINAPLPSISGRVSSQRGRPLLPASPPSRGSVTEQGRSLRPPPGRAAPSAARAGVRPVRAGRRARRAGRCRQPAAPASPRP